MEETRLQKDQRNLSRIFPDVVWLLVYGQLIRSSETVKNMFFASGFFRHLLYSRRNELLFPAVLTTRLMRLIVMETVFHNTARDQYSSNPLLLKLRLICSSWCKIVEEKMLILFESKILIHKKPIRASLRHDDDDEAQFLSHFEKSHSQPSHNKSPFIGNTVCFEVDWNNNGGNAGILDMPLKELLSTYGRYIRQCNLDFHCKAMSKQWFEEALIHAVLSMPNVKALELNMNPKDFVNGGNPANLPDVSNLPEFQTDSLKLHMDKNSDRITRKLLSRMPSLRTLCITLKGEIPSLQNLIPTLSSLRLKNLDLIFKVSDRLIEPSREYLLRHPTLQDHRCFLDAGLHASFRTLEAHSPMNYLRSLHISVNCTLPSSWHEWQKYTINLPNLAEFKLSTWTWPCIDMAFLFRDSLEKLYLHVKSAQTFEEWKSLEGAKELMEKEQIKFLSSSASFDKNSNIWKQISKLAEVTLSIRVTGHPTENRVQRFYSSGKTAAIRLGN